jgi:photosystem I subunit X
MNTNDLIALSNQSTTWSTQIAAIMIACNICAVGIGRYAIQVRNSGPSIPIAALTGFGLTELLATTSLGHIIGAGAICAI